MRSLYERLGGRPSIIRLARAWHARCLDDSVVAHAFSHGFHPQHDERLAAYWAEALGGPADYTSRLGDQSMVTRMHAGNGQHEDMDRRALACFDGALDDIAVGDPALREELLRWFEWGIERMGDYPDAVEDVPEGLAMQVWSPAEEP